MLTYGAPTPNGVWTNSDWGGQKVLWAVDGAVSGVVLVRGRQLDGNHEVRFAENAAKQLLLHAYPTAPGQWRGYPSYTRVQAPGCYAYQVDAASGTTVIVFRAVGPPIPHGGNNDSG